jgi:hypothetical protein
MGSIVVFVSRRERNAVGLKSGDAVAHSAPVLNQPTSPQQPIESRRLSSVQPKSGRGLGRSPKTLAAADAPEGLPISADEIRALASFFELLDTWDRRSNDPPLM